MYPIRSIYGKTAPLDFDWRCRILSMVFYSRVLRESSFVYYAFCKFKDYGVIVKINRLNTHFKKIERSMEISPGNFCKYPISLNNDTFPILQK